MDCQEERTLDCAVRFLPITNFDLYLGLVLIQTHRNIGAALFAGGTVLEILCVMGYMIDSYQKYAASAMAAILVLRSLLAFALPLVAPSL